MSFCNLALHRCRSSSAPDPSMNPYRREVASTSFTPAPSLDDDATSASCIEPKPLLDGLFLPLRAITFLKANSHQVENEARKAAATGYRAEGTPAADGPTSQVQTKETIKVFARRTSIKLDQFCGWLAFASSIPVILVVGIECPKDAQLKVVPKPHPSPSPSRECRTRKTSRPLQRRDTNIPFPRSMAATSSRAPAAQMSRSPVDNDRSPLIAPSDASTRASGPSSVGDSRPTGDSASTRSRSSNVGRPLAPKEEEGYRQQSSSEVGSQQKDRERSAAGLTDSGSLPIHYSSVSYEGDVLREPHCSLLLQTSVTGIDQEKSQIYVENKIHVKSSASYNGVIDLAVLKITVAGERAMSLVSKTAHYHKPLGAFNHTVSNTKTKTVNGGVTAGTSPTGNIGVSLSDAKGTSTALQENDQQPFYFDYAPTVHLGDLRKCEAWQINVTPNGASSKELEVPFKSAIRYHPLAGSALQPYRFSMGLQVFIKERIEGVPVLYVAYARMVVDDVAGKGSHQSEIEVPFPTATHVLPRLKSIGEGSGENSVGAASSQVALLRVPPPRKPFFKRFLDTLRRRRPPAPDTEILLRTSRARPNTVFVREVPNFTHTEPLLKYHWDGMDRVYRLRSNTLPSI